MNVVCKNAECPELDVPKDNARGYAIEEIICGTCNGPVEETAAETNTTTPGARTNADPVDPRTFQQEGDTP